MIKLMHGDCLELMKEIPDNSIDMVLTDPPYGTTQCKWDSVIPFTWHVRQGEKVYSEAEFFGTFGKNDLSVAAWQKQKEYGMWEHLKRVTKNNGAICIFGAQPFTAALIMSNTSMYKYDWVWQKDKATNHLNAKRQPMRRNELISVFYKKQCEYNPQLSKKDPKDIRPATINRKQAENYGAMTKQSIRGIPLDMSYPNETLKFRGCFGDKGKSLHPTQKPTDLLKYLIRTYTTAGDKVLDFTMGSGSTGVASVELGRKFVGIEKEDKYFYSAEKRITSHSFFPTGNVKQ